MNCANACQVVRRQGPSLWDSVVARNDGTVIPVRPDAYVTHHDTRRPDGNNKVHIFLEADRFTMAHTRMAAKISGYLAYYEQGLHAWKYPACRHSSSPQ